MPVLKNGPKILEKMKMNKCESHSKSLTKKIIGVFLAILLLYLIVLVGTMIRNNTQKYHYIGQADRAERTINISASGKAVVTPDIATITMGIVSESETVVEAQEKNTLIMNRLFIQLDELGIERRDVKTQDYSVYPMYNYKEGDRELTGYTVNQDVVVKVRNVDNSGKVLALVGELGLNRVGGVSFSIDDTEVYKNEARQDALKNALEKAKIIAKTLGLEVVGVVSYNEYEQSGIVPYYAKLESGFGGDASEPNIETGTSDVVMNINVLFEIR
ncbi:MAG: SIMPL domain-containing protein [Candidatus Magasanikbacteria bacterium]|nr:SIMPL domain-containing protein [Candidatus Magasanikbacteria bacterium]